MKKKLVGLMIGVCSVMVVACGANNANKEAEVPSTAQEEVVEASETEEATETEEAAKTETESADSSDVVDNEWVGTWYEEKLGMDLTVTEDGDGYKFEFSWPDDANNMTFVWEVNGRENEAGIIAYSNGVASVIEKDADGKETTTVNSDHEKGSIALLEGGTLQWVEEVEAAVEHIFVRK